MSELLERELTQVQQREAACKDQNEKDHREFRAMIRKLTGRVTVAGVLLVLVPVVANVATAWASTAHVEDVAREAARREHAQLATTREAELSRVADLAAKGAVERVIILPAEKIRRTFE